MPFITLLWLVLCLYTKSDLKKMTKMEAEAHESFMVCRELTKRNKRSSAHLAAQTFRSITSVKWTGFCLYCSFRANWRWLKISI